MTSIRREILNNTLNRLAKEFGVSKPNLLIRPLTGLWGTYSILRTEITIDTKIFQTNISKAITTLKHEFYHYLEDIQDLDDKKSELKARRFEKNPLSFIILPKSQTQLFRGESKCR